MVLDFQVSTTILGATKDQQFLKDWKAKVGEKRAEELKIIVVGGDFHAQIHRILCYGSWLR